jgi:tetratricopeptide (TPR) repeat protein
MRKSPWSVAFVALAAALGAPGSTAERWVEARSPSFRVVFDGSQKDARRVLREFEEVRALLHDAWPGIGLATPRPVTILAVRDEDELGTLLPAFWEAKGTFRPAGLFVSAPDRNWVAVRMDAARLREGDAAGDNPYLVVFHEYVHVALRTNFRALPAWLSEGLAEFWGNATIEGDRVYEGRPVSHHVRTLRQRTLLPLASLLAVEGSSPGYSEQDRATLFYAQSWALVHYLMLGSEARRGQVNRFVALLQGGQEAAAAAGEAFGDIEALDRELQSYIRWPVFPQRRRPARVQFQQSAVTASPLPLAQSLAVRACFHVAMDRASEARALAARSLELDPGAGAAHEALALLAWKEGRRSDAREALARATSLPGASDYAYYLYGQLLWESLPAGEGLERVVASFRRAVELNPSFAGAHASLARVQRATGLEPTGMGPEER